MAWREPVVQAVLERSPASFWDYAAIIRPASAVKHLLVVPGIALAAILRPGAKSISAHGVALTFLSVFCAASANYVINEWLDRDFDRYHPDKSGRPCVTTRMSAWAVYAECGALGAAALLSGAMVSGLTAACAAAMLINGMLYNVPPLRLKQVAFADVLCESLSNPIRLVYGWAVIDPATLPPGSVILAYWMGGAFLMSVKRLAEHREFAAAGEIGLLRLYRGSFRFYSDRSLILSAFAYAQFTTFAMAVFIVKYRIEYLLAAPLICLLFCLYLYLGLEANPAAERAGYLLRERLLLGVVAAIVVALSILTFADVPAITSLVNAHYIALPAWLHPDGRDAGATPMRGRASGIGSPR